ncbi:hypothetical protein BDQ17DRAFT_142677 [Cyathus striatus]|nr:hypothetical protein BDQ17DRAFT_142677 [Cyathus striatus]
MRRIRRGCCLFYTSVAGVELTGQFVVCMTAYNGTNFYLIRQDQRPASRFCAICIIIYLYLCVYPKLSRPSLHYAMLLIIFSLCMALD